MALPVQNGLLEVDGKLLPFFSGEIHYWRIDPVYWREALIMAKLGGLTFVSTYIPWDFHEVDEGYTDLGPPLSYDFTGRTDPRKNLIGFLELAQQEGLYVVARPGPVIIAEWRHKGPAFHSFPFEWPEPGYKTALTRWYDAVAQVIVRYSVTNGGPIAICQVDNESHELTVDGARLYFENRYRTAEAFNAKFGTDYPDLATAANDLCQTNLHNIMQTMVNSFKSDNPHLRNEFKLAKHWFMVQMIADFAAMLRERGVTMPLFLNSNGSPDSHDYLGTQGPLDFMALDFYPPYMIPLAAYAPMENACKYLATASRWPISVEFPSSSIVRAWYVKLGPIDHKHLLRSAMIEVASGVQGINYFMYMDRDMASRSPLSETAKPTDSYFAAFHLHRSLLRAGFPATKPQAKIALCWDNILSANLHGTVPNLDWLEMRSVRMEADPLDGYTGLFQALMLGDADFAVVDMRQQDVLKNYDLLLVAGCPEMDAEAYERLQQFGEKVRWVGEAPTKSNEGQPLPAPAGKIIRGLEEIDPALLQTIGVSGTGVRSYLHRLGEDRIVFLLNLDEAEKEVTLQGIDLSGDVVDCWHGANLGPAEGQTYRIPAYGWRLLRITKNPEALTGITRVEREYF
ncbi:MAG TPA: beta-galactosidase [Armatimonadota bacterium]